MTIDPRFKVTTVRWSDDLCWQSLVLCPDGAVYESPLTLTRRGARRFARAYVRQSVKTGTHL